MNDETAFNAMVEEFVAAAAKLMASGEPDLCATRQGFMDVMWPDDHDMTRRGVTRADYATALDEAFDALRRRVKTT